MSRSSRSAAFRVDGSIFGLFRDLRVGVVRAYGIDNHGEREEIIETLRVEEERVARACGHTGLRAPAYSALARRLQSFRR